MCLYANGRYHRWNNGSTKPIITHRPLVVEKVLLFNPKKGYYESPAMYERYELEKLYISCFTFARYSYDKNFRVERGLHSLRVGAPHWSRSDHNGHAVVLPAVIPAGSKLYVGCERDGDVVSDQLIVFKDREKMMQYLGVSTLAPSIRIRDPARDVIAQIGSK